VLRAACVQAARWSALPGGADLRVAVNVFGRQLTEPGFVDAVREHLAVSGLPPHRLWLELTETELLGDDVVRDQLDALARLGVRIALDDFGAGYASLANLQTVPVHQLKLDRRLVLGRDGERTDAMAELIMSVSDFLGLETVAEAVETPEHADWARRAGIPLAQGWLWARPMPPEQFPAWLAGSAVPTAVPAGVSAAAPLPSRRSLR
jgi:EAL domain-containing protein (putative c-di-GMP-specific phosphodiesterase class I)